MRGRAVTCLRAGGMFRDPESTRSARTQGNQTRLQAELEKVSVGDSFWQKLVNTPDDQLDADQIRMLDAPGGEIPE